MSRRRGDDRSMSQRREDSELAKQNFQAKTLERMTGAAGGMANNPEFAKGFGDALQNTNKFGMLADFGAGLSSYGHPGTQRLNTLFDERVPEMQKHKDLLGADMAKAKMNYDASIYGHDTNYDVHRLTDAGATTRQGMAGQTSRDVTSMQQGLTDAKIADIALKQFESQNTLPGQPVKPYKDFYEGTVKTLRPPAPPGLPSDPSLPASQMTAVDKQNAVDYGGVSPSVMSAIPARTAMRTAEMRKGIDDQTGLMNASTPVSTGQTTVWERPVDEAARQRGMQAVAALPKEGTLVPGSRGEIHGLTGVTRDASGRDWANFGPSYRTPTSTPEEAMAAGGQALTAADRRAGFVGSTSASQMTAADKQNAIDYGGISPSAFKPVVQGVYGQQYGPGDQGTIKSFPANRAASMPDQKVIQGLGENIYMSKLPDGTPFYKNAGAFARDGQAVPTPTVPTAAPATMAPATWRENAAAVPAAVPAPLPAYRGGQTLLDKLTDMLPRQRGNPQNEADTTPSTGVGAGSPIQLSPGIGFLGEGGIPNVVAEAVTSGTKPTAALLEWGKKISKLPGRGTKAAVGFVQGLNKPKTSTNPQLPNASNKVKVKDIRDYMYRPKREGIYDDEMFWEGYGGVK